jgi:hypothetical protein
LRSYGCMVRVYNGRFVCLRLFVFAGLQSILWDLYDEDMAAMFEENTLQVQL